jgi:hypothetical protein
MRKWSSASVDREAFSDERNLLSLYARNACQSLGFGISWARRAIGATSVRAAGVPSSGPDLGLEVDSSLLTLIYGC